MARPARSLRPESHWAAAGEKLWFTLQPAWVQGAGVEWVMQWAAEFHRCLTYVVPGTDCASRPDGAELNLTSTSAAAKAQRAQPNYSFEESSELAALGKETLQSVDWFKVDNEVAAAPCWWKPTATQGLFEILYGICVLYVTCAFIAKSEKAQRIQWRKKCRNCCLTG